MFSGGKSFTSTIRNVLDNRDDDDQITTQIKTKIYGVSKRTNAKRDNKNK